MVIYIYILILEYPTIYNQCPSTKEQFWSFIKQQLPKKNILYFDCQSFKINKAQLIQSSKNISDPFLLYNLNSSASVMYSNNNSMSFEDKNEFMPSFQKGADPHFQDFMQQCIQNPAFYNSMKEIFNKKQENISKINSNYNNNQEKINPNNPWISSEYSSFEPIPEVSNKSRPIPSQRFQHQANEKNILKVEEKRLPANPLLKYQSQEHQEQKQKLTDKRKQAKINFDDMPIRTKQAELPQSNRESFDLNSIKQNQSVNIDKIQRLTKTRNAKDPYMEAQERPIKSMAPQEFEKNYQPPVETNVRVKNRNYEDDQQDYNFEEKKTAPAVSKQQKKQISNFQDRPISGTKKQFKQLLKQQFNGQFAEQQIEEEENMQDKKTISRNFLKRGSRQHLSSAMNKSKQPKKEQDLNKSGLGKDRDLTPKNVKTQNRSVSANRVLCKKPKQNLDRSINKGVAKKTLQQSQLDDENMNSRAIKRPPLANDKGKKIEIQTKAHISNNSKVSPLASKKKVKNVFEDNSASSSSSSQEEPYFKAVQHKSNPQNFNEGKIQVIENVYLTKEQLDEILQKYNQPAKIIPKETQSQKLQAIRNKYKQLCHIAAMQRQAFDEEMKNKNEEFQKYKQQQITKIKNEKRIMQRQLKSGSSNQALLREKEQLENMKTELEREKDQFKKKDKNNKIMLDKYKKENQELKSKIERLESQKQTVTSKKYLNSYKSDEFQAEEKISTKIPNNKNKKVQEQIMKQQISYKDIKKAKEATKQAIKPKYQYAEQEPITKNKITNVVKQVKIQNKRLSNFVQDSSSDQNSLQEQHQQQVYSQLQWNSAMKLSDLSKMDLSIKMVTEKMISSLFKFQNNAEYKKFLQAKLSPSRTVVNTTRNAKNAYVANLYSDRSKELIYDNGTRKQTFQNGFNIVYFKNGDIKQTLPDKTVLYYFKQKEVDQITLTNGVNIYRFENNQVEFHFPNGGIEIRHTDGTTKVLGDHTRR